MDRRPVEMVRLEREEEMYEREAVLGRDARDVFPTQAKQQAGGLDPDALKELLGARNFISESELDALRATRGAGVDDGAVSVDKPLAEILRERKEAKDREFQDQWRQMKIGKNRPLEEDELEFLNGVAAAQDDAERAWQEERARQLAEFREAVKSSVMQRQGSPGADEGIDVPLGDSWDGSRGGSRPPPEGHKPSAPGGGSSRPAAAGGKPPPLLPVKPLLKVVPKPAAGVAAAGAAAAAAAATAAAGGTSTTGRGAQPAATTAARGRAVEPASAPPSKKQKSEVNRGAGGEDKSAAPAVAASTSRSPDDEPSNSGGGGGNLLAGLLGDYGSGSDGD